MLKDITYVKVILVFSDVAYIERKNKSENITKCNKLILNPSSTFLIPSFYSTHLTYLMVK